MIPGLPSLEKFAIQGGHAKSSGEFDTNINFGDFSVGGKSDYSDLVKIGAVALVGWLGYTYFIKPNIKKRKSRKKKK